MRQRRQRQRQHQLQRKMRSPYLLSPADMGRVSSSLGETSVTMKQCMKQLLLLPLLTLLVHQAIYQLFVPSCAEPGLAHRCRKFVLSRVEAFMVHTSLSTSIHSRSGRLNNIALLDDDDDDDNIVLLGSDMRRHQRQHRRTLRLGHLRGHGPSYSDNFLLDLHNQAQEEKQAATNSLKVYNHLLNQQQADISEWKDSFDRNGFADFTPPMTDGLKCLMIGDGVFSSSSSGRRGGKMTTTTATTSSSSFSEEAKLPWEDERGAAVTAMEVIQINLNSNSNEDSEGPGSPRSLSSSSSPTEFLFETRPTTTRRQHKADQRDDHDNSNRLMVSDPERPAYVYDCIVDQGLMDSVLSYYHHSDTSEAVEELMFEASTTIREHGIYVLVTSKDNLTTTTKQFLDVHGKMVGLEWIFELDGISNDDRVVSVARRFCTGAMPRTGKLATATKKSRYQL